MPRKKMQTNAWRDNIKRLYRTLEIEPLKLRFNCGSYEKCRASLELEPYSYVYRGNWPYIGMNYGRAIISGSQRRVLVIGMDMAGTQKGEWGKTFGERQTCWQEAFRNLDANNPHAAGTRLIIQHLFENQNLGVFVKQFAYINSVKCAPKCDDNKSRATSIMQNECSVVLKREIDLLRPHLIITEGAYPEKIIKDIFDIEKKPITFDDVPNSPNSCDIYDEREPIILAVPHPAARGVVEFVKKGKLPPFFIQPLNRVKKIV